MASGTGQDQDRQYDGHTGLSSQAQIQDHNLTFQSANAHGKID